MNVKDVEVLLSLCNADEKRGKFSTRLIPGCKKSLGICVPDLRNIAKKIALDDWKSFLSCNVGEFETLELESVYAFTLGYVKPKDDEELKFLLQHLHDFVPYIHDWSVNDSVCSNFKIARKYSKQVWDIMMQYKDSRKEYEVRFVAVMMMSHFLNDEYIDKVFDVLDELFLNSYYSRMGAAWCVATIMAKYRDKCFEYLKRCKLDDWTFNKSIQKMKESFRVCDDDKKTLEGMKR